jgi:prepilin-type N-terminal cleavage/methylation domain-containing protein
MRKGFTLIELLIVVSIIGILAVALIPSLTDAPARARDAGRKAAVNEIVGAVESYNIDKGNYPPGNFCLDPEATVVCDGTYLATEAAEEFVCEYLKNDPPTSTLVGTTTLTTPAVADGCITTTGTYVEYAVGTTGGYSVTTLTETGEGSYTVDRS